MKIGTIGAIGMPPFKDEAFKSFLDLARSFVWIIIFRQQVTKPIYLTLGTKAV